MLTFDNDYNLLCFAKTTTTLKQDGADIVKGAKGVGKSVVKAGKEIGKNVATAAKGFGRGFLKVGKRAGVGYNDYKTALKEAQETNDWSKLKEARNSDYKKNMLLRGAEGAAIGGIGGTAIGYGVGKAKQKKAGRTAREEASKGLKNKILNAIDRSRLDNIENVAKRKVNVGAHALTGGAIGTLGGGALGLGGGAIETGAKHAYATHKATNGDKTAKSLVTQLMNNKTNLNDLDFLSNPTGKKKK